MVFLYSTFSYQRKFIYTMLTIATIYTKCSSLHNIWNIYATVLLTKLFNLSNKILTQRMELNCYDNCGSCSPGWWLKIYGKRTENFTTS